MLTSRPAVHPDRIAYKAGGPPARLSARPTVAEALAERHEREPEAVVAYLQQGDDWCRVTVGDLWSAAVAVARDLRTAGVATGDKVALCADTGRELLAAIFGSMCLGAVPFVAEPPLTAARSAQWAERFHHMAAVARPTAVFTAGPVAEVVAKTGADLGLPVVQAPLRPAEPGDEHGLPCAVSEDALAYLQFSSGTTGDAKAAALTHRQLRANVAAIGGHCYVQGDLMVGWLPLHHDMGLVGTVFSTFFHSLPVALMPPLSFAMRPERWPQAISYFRATQSPAPNFAYQLCATRASDDALAGVDLSSWRIATNGAETVSPETLRLWQQRMGPAGFAPGAMQPCYGMAEVALALTMPRIGSPPRALYVDREELARTGQVVPIAPGDPNAEGMIAVGRPLPGYGVRVVDGGGRELPPYQQGRLLVGGPSLTDGYLAGDSAEQGVLQGGPEDGWLESGDIGFFADGDLFVNGRSKDLIIIAGSNYLPYGLERAVADTLGRRPGAVAAVGVPRANTGTESLVIVAEVPAARIPEKAAEVAGQIGRAVLGQMGLSPGQVIVVRPGSLPRTSSGKVQRHKVISMIVKGEFADTSGQLR